MSHLGKGLVNLPEEDRLPALDTIQATILEQPHKIPLLSGALQIANSINSSIGKITVESFHTRLQEAVNTGKWALVKQITRFISCLYPLIDGAGEESGAFKLLNIQLDRAIELQKAALPSRSPLGEELYTSVMISLPYLCSTLILSVAPSETKTAITDLIAKSREYATIHKDIQYDLDPEILSPFVGDSKPYQPQLFIKLLMNSINDFEENGYATRHLIDLPRLIELDIVNPQEVVLHQFPAVGFPEADELVPYNGTIYKAPRIYFSAYFPIRGVPTVPESHTFEALLFRDVTTDVISNMDFNRNEVARQLMTFDLFYAKTSFTEPGISIDRLLTLHETQPSESTWKVEDVALESVLEGLFRIPTTEFYGSYFHAILIEACIMAPQAIAPVFGRAIRFLYDNIETLDIELQNRFLDWFAHHLSNFRFLWKWPEWKDNVNLPDLHPKKAFMEQLILKELRLSYPQRIRESLPEELLHYVAVIPEEPVFKWLEPESQYIQEVGQLVEFLREDKEKEAVDDLLKSIRDKASESHQNDGTGSVDPTSTLVDIVVSTTCYLGNRSLSHIESWVTRVKEILVEICSMDPTTAFESIFEYWIDQPNVALLVTTTFIRSGVLSPKSFIQTLFDYTRGGQIYNQDPVAPIKLEDGSIQVDGIPFEQKRKNMWPHWRLLMTSHGWEMLLRLVEYSISEDSELASTERDELFIDIVSQFQKLLTLLEEDANEADVAAVKAADEADAKKPVIDASSNGNAAIKADGDVDNEDEVVEDDPYGEKDTEMTGGEVDSEEIDEHRKAQAQAKLLAKDADSKQWAVWWVKGVSRSLIRHYHELFKKAIENQGAPQEVSAEGSYILEILKQISAV